MNFNNHSNLEGQHAFLGASKYHWINYGEDKVAEAYRNFLATQKGTVLHAFAAQCIMLNQKLPKSKQTISTVAGEYTVPQGYHDGSGKVSIDATEQAKLIATNIREGVTILGVEGAMSGSEDMKPQSKEVTPSKEAQTIMPDEEYNCLSQVTVKAIQYVETDNSAGGKTVTIG